MDEMRKPAYWAVIPAKVRYDPELRPNAKLLYAEISALADMRGYCFASNTYLSKLFGIAPRTLRELLQQLAEKKYITVEIIRDDKNEVSERRIWIDKPSIAIDGENPPYPSGENPPYPSGENPPYPSGENPPHNNTSNINNNPPIVPQGGRRKKERKTSAEWENDRFEKFWASYPRGEKKQAAIAAWDKLHADDRLLNVMAVALKRQLSSADWKRGVGIPYASTWLNQRRWEDEDHSLPEAEADNSWIEEEVF